MSFFNSKKTSRNIITLLCFEGTRIIRKKVELAKPCNEFLISIVKNIEIYENLLLSSSSDKKCSLLLLSLEIVLLL